MKRALAVLLALAIAPCMVACSSGETDGGDQPAAASEGAASEDFDYVDAYSGQWRGSVETSGSTAYGDVTGAEVMLDVYLNEDGSCSVEPVEKHNDLPASEGTWSGTESQITMSLDGKDVVMTVVDKNTLAADAADFGIDGFDTLDLTFY